MSHSEASGLGKAGSSHLPAQTDTGTTPATPTGAGSSTDTAPSSSNNTNPSELAWTTVSPWRTPARRGRGGSASGAYNNPADRAVNTRGRGAWNNGTSGRAPARSTTPGTTAAMSSNSWAKGPPGRAQAASTNSRSTNPTGLGSTAEVYQEKPVRQYVPTEPTAPGPTAIPPKASYQGSTTSPPTKNWRNLNEFVTGKAGAPAPAQAVTTGEPSGEPRTPVAAEAPLTVVHNASTTGAANDTVIEKAAVGDPTNKQNKAATDGRPETHGVRMNKNIEYPENPHSLTNPLIAYESLMPRTRYNQSGREANVNVNSHRVTTFPDKNVYQYDILIGNGIEKRGLIRSVWESQAVKSKIGDYFIFDGNRIGWSMQHFEKELVFEVDLDEERKVPAKEGRPPNRHRVIIRKTNKVNLSTLKFYLERRANFDNSVLEAINFLDHLLRETPSKINIAVKRSYFSRNKVGKEGGMGSGREDLGGGIEAMKGVYQSIRMAEGGKLVINVDVSNSTFWKDAGLHILAKEITGAKSVEYIPALIKSIPGGGPTGALRESPQFGALRRLCKNEIRIMHRNCSESVAKKTFRIERIRQENAREPSVEIIDKQTGTKQMFSVEKYFATAHKVHLNFPELPLVEVGKKGALYPMELCHMVYGQRYPYRLDPEQTTKMISFAISKPEIRKKDIKERVARLDWEHDPFLSNYGLKIEPNMLKTKARVLNSPEVQFSKASARPGTFGQWNLLGKQFLRGNTFPLTAWGIYVFGLNPKQDIEEGKLFIKSFIRVYRQHGGKIDTEPVMIGGNRDCAEAVTILFNEINKTHGRYPQLMFFVLRGPNNQIYSRIKKSADCRYGVVSQCVQSSHLRKNQDQYLSNVCMKVNAKLGGTTSQVRSAIFSGSQQVPPMIIGADVSHAAPGSSEASFAALTVSMDPICARYAAAVEANGFRAEMITTKNIEKMLTPLIEHWKRTIGNGRIPNQVYYFRDGVSAGQYQAVLKFEVEVMKQLFAKLGREKTHKPKFTVVIAEKRHHIRFFPESGDRNGNPLPGTLVEKDVTHPFEYDFYLCSHKAIMGTARPTHYHILKDECEHRGDSFQNMIYEHCYQYMRSTTSVSLFPAVYYAHLASKRARSHVGHLQKPIEQQKTMPAGASLDAELLPLEEMRNDGEIQTSMWYI